MATFHENLVQSFTNFKNKFLKANGKDFHFAYDSTTQKYGYTIDGTFYPFRKVQASKTVTAGTSAITVTPDTGNDGIGSVTVNPTPSETKTQAAGTSNIDVTPTSGKLLSKVTVTPTPSQTKSVTATTTAQDVTPDSGKLLSKVTVNPQSHTATYTFPANDTGAKKDLGATNSYRYVSATNVYSKGSADGGATARTEVSTLVRNRVAAYNSGVSGWGNINNQTDANNYVDTAYNQGVANADARANPSSANYQAGYNAGRAVINTYGSVATQSYSLGRETSVPINYYVPATGYYFIEAFVTATTNTVQGAVGISCSSATVVFSREDSTPATTGSGQCSMHRVFAFAYCYAGSYITITNNTGSGNYNIGLSIVYRVS